VTLTRKPLTHFAVAEQLTLEGELDVTHWARTNSIDFSQPSLPLARLMQNQNHGQRPKLKQEADSKARPVPGRKLSEDQEKAKFMTTTTQIPQDETQLTRDNPGSSSTETRHAPMKLENRDPLPLAGIKVIDFTGVQAGPACCQMLAWFGADVLKVERTGVGDVTRRQLRDIPDVDALYFTQLNSNKRSLELDTKTAEGKEILEKLIREADVLVENFRPGAMDRMGFSWERIQELNPRIIFGSVKGFSPGSPYEDISVYDNVAQCAGGGASTTGFWDGPPTVSGAALGDSNTGMHLLIGILAALVGREKTGKGQRVEMSMQDAVLNLCRVKLRDQLRLERLGYLEEYPQYPNGKFGDAVPRGGNAGGGGQPGWVLKCKGWETDPNSYIYFTIQEQNWERTCEAIGKPEWAKDPAYATAKARQPHIFAIFAEIEKWLADKTKFEAVKISAQVRGALRAGAFDEGSCPRSIPARQRQHRRGAAQETGQVSYCRLPDEVLQFHA
jgi:formyl-CoA transferase